MGIRQGDPISPLIFALTIEICLEMLRNSLSGIYLGQNKIVLQAYTDDLAVLIKDTEEETIFMNIIQKIRGATVVSMNISKTQVIKIGNKENNLNILSDNYTNTPVYLGLPISLSGIEHDILKSQVMNKFEKWQIAIKNRILSLYSKVLLINSMLLPQLTYYCEVSFLDDAFLSELTNEIIQVLKIPKSIYGLAIHKKQQGWPGLVVLKLKRNSLFVKTLRETKSKAYLFFSESIRRRICTTLNIGNNSG